MARLGLLVVSAGILSIVAAQQGAPPSTQEASAATQSSPVAQDQRPEAPPSSNVAKESRRTSEGKTGNMKPPQVRFAPDAEYSKQAKQAHITGTVILVVLIDEQGLPRDIKVQRGLGYGLDENAIEAVRKWKFKPATKDGRPFAVRVNIEINFHP